MEERTRNLVTTKRLGKAAIPDLPYEQADGTPIRINTDYFGKKRNESNPTPGPFENPGTGPVRLKVRNSSPRLGSVSPMALGRGRENAPFGRSRPVSMARK